MASHELIILLALVNVYLLAVYLLRKKGWFEDSGLSMFGPALMIRTQRGKALIDRIAGPKELWRKYGDVVIALTIVFGVLMVAVILAIVPFSFQVPEGQEVTPQQALLIPGVNPFVPLGYGLMALVIAIVIHEFAHGVVARAHDLTVKSLGLLVLVVPVGAFMEPDEDELHSSHPRTRTRVFAAGAGTSILISFVFAGIYSFGFIPMVEPAAPGMGVVQSLPDTPAEEIGLQGGMIVVAVNGTPATTPERFRAAFDGLEPGDRTTIEVHSAGQRHTRTVELIDQYAYLVDRCVEGGTDRTTCEDRVPDELQGEPFLGVTIVPPELFLRIQQPSTDLGVTFQYLFLPVQGLSPVNSPYANFYTIQGPLAGMGLAGFWMVANSFYWLFWINFLLGTFNALPLPILDGGHVYKEGVRKIVRWRGDPSEEHVDRRVAQATKAATIVLVVALAIQLVAPWIVNRLL